MVLNHDVTQLLPREDVELVVSIWIKRDIHHDQAPNGAPPRSANHLSFPSEGNVTKRRYVGDLPRTTSASLDLDRDIPACRIRDHNVEMRYVPGEGSCNQSAPT